MTDTSAPLPDRQDAPPSRQGPRGGAGRSVARWLLRTSAIREARGRLTTESEAQTRAREQLSLAIDAARRLTEPAETLPSGSRPALLLSLYRDAVYWALAARRPGGAGQPPADLPTVWAEAPADVLLAAAGDRANLEAIESAVLERARLGALEGTEDDVARVSAFCEELGRSIDAPARELDRLLTQRWGRLLGLVVGLSLAIWGLRAWVRGPNLLADRPFQTSSTLAACPGSPDCAGLLFHTNVEQNPWVEFDLGETASIRRLEVENREDPCCVDRAVPLIAETSVDRAHWTEVARRDTTFTTWTAKVTPRRQARYLRLRVPRLTALHLKDVTAR